MERPQILDERDDHEVVKLLDPSNGRAAAMGRGMRSQGLELSDASVNRSLRRQGLKVCIKTRKPLSTKKTQGASIFIGEEVHACDLVGLELCGFFWMSQIQFVWLRWAAILLEEEWRASLD